MLPWKHGAFYNNDDNSTIFRVWAPLASSVKLVVTDGPNGGERLMKPTDEGYFEVTLADCGPGVRYLFQLDDQAARPDPASRWQPDGVHQASAVAETRFKWTDDAWAGLPIEEYVIYELHVGTFTQEGTFEAAIAQLARLKVLGITAVEIMPVAQFPGTRNWGYDGVYPYAVQNNYGGVEGLQRFVDAAHGLELAVIMDVVYNHLGPEGNYLSTYGPYFTAQYQTPWGPSLNFDGPFSDGVRDFFIGNALYWIEVCHMDALRLDAVHAIIDTSANPFLKQLTAAVHESARRMHKRVHVTGENDRNDPKFTVSKELGGIGADSQWSDDFHHALHALVTGERHGYYKDFGLTSQLGKAYTDGFVYDGCYSPHRRRHHGADSRPLPGIRFIVCSQNHDQVGNRPRGERLSQLLNFSQTKLTALAMLGSPYLPLIFMGEEYGLKTPFQYFVSHSDEHLIEAVREGRAREFHEFFSDAEAPDPQTEAVFRESIIQVPTDTQSLAVNALYRDLLKLRKDVPALRPKNKRYTTANADDDLQTLIVSRYAEDDRVLLMMNFSGEPRHMSTPAAKGRWKFLLHTEWETYGGAEPLRPDLTCDGHLVLELPPHCGAILSLLTESHCKPSHE